MQYLSLLLPPAYVFEELRKIVSGNEISASALLWGGSLAMLYILLACGYFVRIYQHAVRTGLIARYSVESIS